MLDKIKETAAFLAGKVSDMPRTAIILGTGLGTLVDYIEDKQYIPYSEIPNFPVSTVEGHSGNLIFGTLGGKRVMAMQGRFHYYEGYDMKQVTFPVRVMRELGVETLFVSNAAGGMNKEFRVGDVMVICDQINLFPENPLRCKNYSELGPCRCGNGGRLRGYPRLFIRSTCRQNCRGTGNPSDARRICGHYRPDVRDSGRI